MEENIYISLDEALEEFKAKQEAREAFTEAHFGHTVEKYTGPDDSILFCVNCGQSISI